MEEEAKEEISISEESDPEEAPQLDPREVNDLIFLVQSLGCTKYVGNVETYIKNEESIEFLKELYKHLRNENPDSTLKRLELGEWNIVESDLLKLLVSYPQDRQLAFYVIIVLVSLTEKPQKEHFNFQKCLETLQNYKLSFVTSKDALKVIVSHLAECMSKPSDERNEQHDQMLELIVYLFRNLLAIPDRSLSVFRGAQRVSVYNSREDNFKDLQRRLLHKLADETILEAIVYMAHDFTKNSARKLNLCFLEIFYYILKDFEPKKMFEDQEYSLLSAIRQKEREKKKLKMREMSSRHSKFGSNYKMKRSINGTSIVYHNPFKEQIELNKVPQQQTKAIRRKETTELTSKKELATVDSTLIKKIKHFASEVLEHCFEPLVESIFVEFYKESDKLEAEDKTCYFLFQAFMFEFLRCKCKGSQLEVSYVAEALKLPNFEYLYRSFVVEFKKTAKKDFNTREVHSAIKFLTQFLYLIQEMSQSSDELTNRNAKILMQNVFYHEMARVCRKAFDYWEPGVNKENLLLDIIELNQITFQMLEQYSKGKALTVRTEKIIQNKKPGDESEDYMSEEEPQSEVVYKERQLNFDIEFSLLVDPSVISKYCFVLRNYKENSHSVNLQVTEFLKRILKECQAEWVFFQLEYLNIFNNILNDRTIDSSLKELQQVVAEITHKFFELMKTNRLVVVEALFRIKDRATKNLILSNYEELELDQEPELSETVWTREEDELLVENYPTFKDLNNSVQALSSLFGNKTQSQVKARIKKLKLHKGTKNLDQLYEEVPDLRNALPKAYEKFGQEKVKEVLEVIKQEHKEFLELFDNCEYALVPLSPQDFEFYTDKVFENLLSSIGFRPPKDGEWCWRLNSTSEDLTQRIQDLLADESHEEPEEEFYSSGNFNSLFGN